MAAVLALLMFRQASPDVAGLGYAVLSGALASGVGYASSLSSLRPLFDCSSCRQADMNSIAELYRLTFSDFSLRRINRIGAVRYTAFFRSASEA